MLILLVAVLPAVLLVTAASLRGGARPETSASAAPWRSALRTSPSPSGAATTWTLIGAGDIADCDVDDDAETARLVESIPGAVFTAGDNAYPHGSARDFADCFEPTWGRFRERIRPAIGDHEYLTIGAAGYFDYFGAAAGLRGLGYYSYELGPWLVVVLNTNCDEVPGGCGPDSPQVTWLRGELVGSGASCAVAVSAHPRFSSGFHGNNLEIRHLFDVLYEERAELLLSGHDHDYERLAPSDPEGFADARRGVRQFVVGTGGHDLRGFGEREPISEFRAESTFGVLHLTLADRGYRWAFLDEHGRALDTGGDSCH